MKTVVLGVLSYNNPSYTDRLCDNIFSKIKEKYSLIVLDNGSDKDKISKNTTDIIENNRRMTGGFNSIIDIANIKFPTFDYIWFFTNDCYFTTDQDPLLNMLEKYKTISDLGILHPSLSPEVKVCYDIKNTGRKGVKIVNEYDFVCPMFSKNALESIGGRFNNKFFYGWGIDHESSFLVRKNNLLVGINHDIIVNHNTSTTYDNGLDCLFKNRNEYYDSAGLEMRTVLSEQYGSNWNILFKTNYNKKVGVWYE